MSSWPALHPSHSSLTDISGFVFAFFAGGGSSCGEWKRSGCVLSLEEDALVFLELFPGFGGILKQARVLSSICEFFRETASRACKTTAGGGGGASQGNRALPRAHASRIEGMHHVLVYRSGPASQASCRPLASSHHPEWPNATLRRYVLLILTAIGVHRLALQGLAMPSRDSGYCRRA